MWTQRLSSQQADQVLALAAAAIAADGVDPLNEEARFALRDDSAEHLIAPSGYLHWSPSHRTAQLVVHPEQRRRGTGRRLLAQLGDRPSLGTWAFGDLPAARGFAAALGLRPARELLIMSRALAGVEMPQLPDGLTLRGYEPGDADALLAVNAAAFASHPEQGSLDRAGLTTRMAEPWFDPAGLILGFDADGLAGFHWTKPVDSSTGEVYVIGIAPRTQGRGYGQVLLAAGLSHLERTGHERVELYVDSSESVAVRMYERNGFHITHRDVLYAPGHDGSTP